MNIANQILNFLILLFDRAQTPRIQPHSRYQLEGTVPSWRDAMRKKSPPISALRLLVVASLAGATLLLTACASAPKAPIAALSEAKVAINSAEKAEANRYAGPELAEARLKLVQADAAVTGKNMVEADRLAHQSRLAAELAIARTETAKALAVNEELSKGLEALNEELNRPGDKG